MNYIEKISLSKEKVAYYEKIMKDEDLNTTNYDEVIETIVVPFKDGMEAHIKLYPTYNKNELLLNGREVDSFEFTDEFVLGKYTFHHEKDNYTVIMEEKGEVENMEKDQLTTLLIEQGYDTEIYSDESVDHENALIEFLSEKGVILSSSDLTERTETPFIDADSVAGIRAVVTIIPYELEVHMVAFHHREWDYYINEVKDVVKKEEKLSPDVVLLQTELESGLGKKDIHQLTSMLPDKVHYVPFSTAENNSSAHGFIKASTLEQYDWDSGEIESFVKEIIDDIGKESEDGYYTMENGITLYIGYTA